MAPNRRPWMAASTATTTTTTSTTFIAPAPGAWPVRGGMGKMGPAPPTKRRRTGSGPSVITPLPRAHVARSAVEFDHSAGLIRTAGIASEMSGVVRE